MTQLRKLMLEEIQRRNFTESTTRAYLRIIEDFARHFHRPPDQLGPDHIRERPQIDSHQWPTEVLGL